MPLTNRLLIDGAAKTTFERAIRDPIRDVNPAMISVLEQSTGRQYRARQFFINRTSDVFYYRAAVSYITGAHSFKFGVGDISGSTVERDWDINPVSYRFNNGVPNQITMRAYPIDFAVDVDHQFGAYAQDRWTIDRLTVNAGLRLDWFKNSFPAQSIGPTPLAPTRNFQFPDTAGLNLKDLSPKLSAAYDLKGDGKTALKVSLNRNVEPYTVGGIAGANNPIVRLATTTNRSWTDANGNYIPDCNLLVLTANGECGAVANPLFGSAGAQANFDPDVLQGWGKRLYNWEFSAGVQRQVLTWPLRGRHLLPPLVRQLHHRRQPRGHGGRLHTVQHHRTRGFASAGWRRQRDLRALRRQPGQVRPDRQHHDLREELRQAGADVERRGSDGQRADGARHHRPGRDRQGHDHAGRLRYPGKGAGVFGRGSVLGSGCRGRDKHVSTLLLAGPTAWHCHTERPQTQVKLLGSYTVPKIELQVSSTLQSIPGPEIAAFFTATNARHHALARAGLCPEVRRTCRSIWSRPGQCTASGSTSWTSVLPGRCALGRAKTTFQLDLYNALNVDAVTGVNTAYATWLRPQAVILGRFAKLGVQFDF